MLDDNEFNINCLRNEIAKLDSRDNIIMWVASIDEFDNFVKTVKESPDLKVVSERFLQIDIKHPDSVNPDEEVTRTVYGMIQDISTDSYKEALNIKEKFKYMPDIEIYSLNDYDGIFTIYHTISISYYLNTDSTQDNDTREEYLTNIHFHISVDDIIDWFEEEIDGYDKMRAEDIQDSVYGWLLNLEHLCGNRSQLNSEFSYYSLSAIKECNNNIESSEELYESGDIDMESLAQVIKTNINSLSHKLRNYSRKQLTKN